MKTSSKKMAAEISAALTNAIVVKSSSKKILKKIDNTAKKMAKKINKRIKNTASDPKEKNAKGAAKTKKNKKGEVPKLKETKLLTEMASDEVK